MWVDPFLEKNQIPDFLIRWGARRMTAKRLREIRSGTIEEHQAYLQRYIAELTKQPIAIHTADDT
ncbi:MAG: hypothetical protein SCM88_14100 [Bacillota bacterium]|nr:hypothetical protein [Bacillota bacterium]